MSPKTPAHLISHDFFKQLCIRFNKQDSLPTYPQFVERQQTEINKKLADALQIKYGFKKDGTLSMKN